MVFNHYQTIIFIYLFIYPLNKILNFFTLKILMFWTLELEPNEIQWNP